VGPDGEGEVTERRKKERRTRLALAEQEQSDDAFLPAGITFRLDGGIDGGADLASMLLALEAEEAFLGGLFWGGLEEDLEGVYGNRHGMAQGDDGGWAINSANRP
jgi:hypothetical protein